MREWAQQGTHQLKFRRPASFVVFIPILFMSINVIVYLLKTDTLEKVSHDNILNSGQRKLLVDNEENCTEPAVLDFPLLRLPGGKWGKLILPFVACIYIYILLARVCDDYFIASIKIICLKIGFSGDVAGATVMAAATSSPELFMNMVGTFVTQGNIGVGTIIGSAVFNILAVPGLCSFFSSSKVLTLDYWPLIRDSIAYCISLFILCFVLRDGTVHWYEALLLVTAYAAYIVMMNYNNIIRNKFEARFVKYDNKYFIWDSPEKWPLINPKLANGSASNGHVPEEILNYHGNRDLEHVCHWPPGSNIFQKIWWVFTWPITFLLACTVPNCQTWKKLYMATFVICICWIGVGSYLIAWMITISGYLLKIPDSVMGLTFIAAGMCIPETISSIIVSKQGQGSMALANALGSNIFDTLFCFGLPWLVQTTYFMSTKDSHHIEVTTTGLEYDTVILLVTLLILFTIIAMNKFQLTKFAGYMCLLMYLIFISASVAIEMLIVITSDTAPICSIDL